MSARPHRLTERTGQGNAPAHTYGATQVDGKVRHEACSDRGFDLVAPQGAIRSDVHVRCNTPPSRVTDIAGSTPDQFSAGRPPDIDAMHLTGVHLADGRVRSNGMVVPTSDAAVDGGDAGPRPLHFSEGRKI